MKNIIAYHGVDADGWFSATLVRKVVLASGCKISDICFVPMTYAPADEQRLESILKDAIADADEQWSEQPKVIMVDFTASNNFMDKYASYIYHFDHHITAVNDKLPWYSRIHKEKSRVYFDGESNEKDPKCHISACELIYAELYATETSKKDGISIDTIDNLAIHYVGRRDVWDLRDIKTQHFHYGLLAFINGQLYNSREGYTVADMVADGKFEIFLSDPLFVASTIATGKRLYPNLIYHHYRESIEDLRIAHVHTTTEDTQKDEKIPLLDVKVAYANKRLPSEFFTDKWKNEHQDVEATIFYQIVDDKLIVTCKSIKNNYNALQLLRYVVHITGMEDHCSSLGGHMPACGGIFDYDQIVPLTKFLHERTEHVS